jgi:hypothetical protein
MTGLIFYFIERIARFRGKNFMKFREIKISKKYEIKYLAKFREISSTTQGKNFDVAPAHIL